MSEGATTTAAPVSTPAPTAATSIPSVPKAPAGKVESTASSKTSTKSTDTSKESAEAKTAAEEFFEAEFDGRKIKMSRSEVAQKLANQDSITKQAYSKFEEAAKLRKEADEKLANISDPKKAIKFLTSDKSGLKPEEVRAAFEEWYNDSFIAPEQMTAEQRRIAQLEKENREHAEYRQQQERAEKESREARELEAMSGVLQKELAELVSLSGLPKTKFTMSRVAYWQRVNEAKGIQAPKEMVVQQVKNEAQGILKGMTGGLEGDALATFLGEEVVKKIRAYDLARIREKRGQKAPEESGQKEPTNNEIFEKLRPSDVKRRAREMFR